MRFMEAKKERPCSERGFLAGVPKLGALIARGAKKVEAKEQALQAKLQQEEEIRREQERVEKDDISSIDASSSEVREMNRQEGRVRATQSGEMKVDKTKKKAPARRAGQKSQRGKAAKGADDTSDKGGETMSDSEIKAKLRHDGDMSPTRHIKPLTKSTVSRKIKPIDKNIDATQGHVEGLPQPGESSGVPDKSVRGARMDREHGQSNLLCSYAALMTYESSDPIENLLVDTAGRVTTVTILEDTQLSMSRF